MRDAVYPLFRKTTPTTADRARTPIPGPISDQYLGPLAGGDQATKACPGCLCVHLCPLNLRLEYIVYDASYHIAY